jgi:hypothetical protein
LHLETVKERRWNYFNASAQKQFLAFMCGYSTFQAGFVQTAHDQAARACGLRFRRITDDRF